MTQLWSVSKLNDVPLQVRRKLRFYAPLTESLDFMGVDPVTFTRASASSAMWRDGASHTIGQHVPRFEYDAVTQFPLGLLIGITESLVFNPANYLHNADTLIWFEEATPKSTPTNVNPFDATGAWTGNRNIHIKHIVKAIAGMTLSESEIMLVQEKLGDIAQNIPIPAPEIPVTGEFFYATHENTLLGGTVNSSNVVFTLGITPNITSMLVFAHGSSLKQVASSPGEQEYTVGGVNNRTLTLGLGPAPNIPFFVQGVVA